MEMVDPEPVDSVSYLSFRLRSHYYLHCYFALNLRLLASRLPYAFDGYRLASQSLQIRRASRISWVILRFSREGTNLHLHIGGTTCQGGYHEGLRLYQLVEARPTANQSHGIPPSDNLSLGHPR